MAAPQRAHQHRLSMAARIMDLEAGRLEYALWHAQTSYQCGLTRLGESGCDAWTVARIAGHSAISMSMGFVHPSQAAVEKAMTQLSGHNPGHSNKERGPRKARAGTGKC
jgi:hypothetical protein